MTAPESGVSAQEVIARVGCYNPEHCEGRQDHLDDAGEVLDALTAAGYVVLPREALDTLTKADVYNEHYAIGQRECDFCDASEPDHEPDCPWLLAIEATR